MDPNSSTNSDKESSNRYLTNSLEEGNLELITAYLDNELNPSEKKTVEELIKNNGEYEFHYIFENLTKNTFKNRLNSFTPPQYLYTNIYSQINQYINNSANNKQVTINYNTDSARSYTGRYVMYSVAALLTIAILIASGYFMLNNVSGKNKDLVEYSKNSFLDMKDGKSNVQYSIGNAKQLTAQLQSNVNFKVFIPDVKEAQLIGGTVNEVNGTKFVHFIHKMGNSYLYTIETAMDEMKNNDKVSLEKEFKDQIAQGKNWIICNGAGDHAVIWYKDNVICSTVSSMDCKQVSSILTDYK